MAGYRQLVRKLVSHISGWKIFNRGPLAALRFARARRWKNRILDRTFPDCYEDSAKEPVDPRKVLVVENRLTVPNGSFRLILETLQERSDVDVHIHYLRETFVSKAEYEKRCLAMLRDMATAGCVFICEANPVISCVKVRPETKVVQLWHACGAFKKFGLSTADKKFGANEEEHSRHPLYNNYSLVTVSSPEVVWAYAEAMGLEKRKDIIRPTGISRTDIFFREDAARAAVERIYGLFPAAREKKIILFAPTFRGRISTAKTAEAFDVSAFAKAFAGEYVLIMKHHPMVRSIPPLPRELEGSFVYDATKTAAIEDLLLVSDICISDYSSLVFEYSLLERPMLFFAYDIDTYDDWRGFYYDYEEMTPGPVCRTNEEMIHWIRHLEELFDRQQVKEFKERFMSACDGHATERILLLAMNTIMEPV